MSEEKKPKLGRPTKYTESKGKELIEAMKQGYSYEAASAMLGVCEKTLFNWEKEHPDFLQSKKEAFRQNRIFWEKAGLEGMFMGGKDNPFNSTVWVFNMKNRFNWTDKRESKVESKVKLENLIDETFKDEE